MRAAVRISVSQRVHVKAWNFSEANLQIVTADKRADSGPNDSFLPGFSGGNDSLYLGPDTLSRSDAGYSRVGRASNQSMASGVR